jgi:hypothetical protein
MKHTKDTVDKIFSFICLQQTNTWTTPYKGKCYLQKFRFCISATLGDRFYKCLSKGLTLFFSEP